MDIKEMLHPYRFQIVASLSEKEGTVKSLKKRLPTIPHAALYRSVKKLLEAGIIRKISEERVKSTVEVTYGLNISMEKMRIPKGSLQNYLNAATMVFFSYVFTKLSRLKRQDRLHESRFNTIPVKVHPEDMVSFQKDFAQLIDKYKGDTGQSYRLSLFLVPEDDDTFE